MHELLNGFEIVALFSVFSTAYRSPKMCILNSTNADGSAVCCANYHSKNGNCDSCAPGYFGDACEKKCPNGTFGEGCAGKCDPHCSLEVCDHAKGCPDIDQSQSTILVDTSFQTIPQQQVRSESSSSSSPSFKSSSLRNPSTTLSTKITQMSTVSIISGSTDNNFNILYLLVGVGALIALFLLVIIVQLCLRSKSAKRRISKRQSGDYSDIKGPADHTKYRQSDRKKYNELRHYRNRDNFYQQVESDYQEIDQCLEMASKPTKKDKSFGSKQSKDSPKPSDTYLSPIAEKEQTDKASSDAYIEPVPHIKTKHVQSAIDPLIKQSSSKGEIHSYIEILDSGEVQPESRTSSDDSNKSSSSYDDVVGEASIISHNLSDRKNDTYLDVVT